MKRNAKIKDLDTLEKEIYRLKLEAKLSEGRMEKNLEVLKKNFPYLIFNSLLSKKTNGVNHTNGTGDGVHNIILDVADHIAEYATTGIKDKIDRLFGRG